MVRRKSGEQGKREDTKEKTKKEMGKWESEETGAEKRNDRDAKRKAKARTKN